MRWRYYCGFCKKSGGSRIAMENHERGCTANADRQCGLCRHAEKLSAPLPQMIQFCRENVTDLQEAYNGLDYGTISKDVTAKLRELADGCPVCMFAAMRQAHVYPAEPFDLKTECRSIWADINEERTANIRYG
jgi:hypothetical protein